MGVLLSNASLGLRRRGADTYDGHGTPLPGTLGPLQAALPGLVRERGDGGWTLGLDPALWPAGEGDVVVEPGTGREWLVVRADLLVNVADPVVDWVRVDALERKGTSTEPGGPEFATR